MLIAIEGIDGSGKGTQAARLVETLRSEGRSAALLGFPRYDQTFFGARVGEFLNGRYGSLEAVDPFLVSLLFAGDRLESKPVLEQALAAHEFVVLDRYVPSNVAHQAAKRTGAQRDTLRGWIEHVEYGLFGLPRPDRVVLLDLPAQTAATLVAKKSARNYTARAADLQEADIVYQDSVRRMYLDLSRGDSAWRCVEVLRDGKLRPIESVAADVRAGL
jgi:dTMP kinase